MNFLSPWILLGLGVLPLLWWLIRSLPPRPHEQSFPSLILLRKLTFEQQQAAHTPFWLLILRLLAITSLILGLAGLYKTPPRKGNIPQKLLLIMDNGWATIPQWPQRQQVALRMGLRTLQQGGTVTLLLTARGDDGQWPQPFTTSDPRQFETTLNQLKPSPWASDRHHLLWQLSHAPVRPFLREAETVLLSDGLAEPADSRLKAMLSASPQVRDVRWQDCSVMQLYSTLHGTTLHVMAEAMNYCPARTLPLKGLSLEKNGHFTPLADWMVTTNKAQDISLDPALFASLNALSLSGVPFPAGLSLLKAPTALQNVGLLRQTGDDKPLTGDIFYLKRALTNFTKTHDVTPSTLKQLSLSVLIAPDDTLGSEETRKAVLEWVRGGGLLIRFAGPELAKAAADQTETHADSVSQALMTVLLRPQERSLGGSMSWNVPQTLAPFPDNTPLAGLEINKDITIRRQLIAQPSEALPRHVWASLNDGTPLITTRQEGKGRIILFHITSTANWSNLPLSGLFPQMLERLVNHAPHGADDPQGTVLSQTTSQLVPWKVLSTHNILSDPAPIVRPVDPHSPVTIEPEHPVGFYGSTPQILPLNLARTEKPLVAEIPLGILTKPDFSPLRTLWGPYLTALALVLLLIDSALSFKRTRTLPFASAPAGQVRTGLFFLCLGAGMTSASAQSPSLPPEALHPGLGYIRSGDADQDRLSQQALDGLTRYINQRSTAHLGPPHGVSPGQDDLAFYPVLYWPLTPSSQIDGQQAAALNDYMAHNGLLLIDEMGAGTVINQTSLSSMNAVLTAIGQHLTIPALEIVTDDHILARSFYLLHDFPGRITGQTVYSARLHIDEGEDVSPIIIGNNDWAHAWAIDEEGHTPYAVLPEGEEQRALAYRFGMNIVIYALTGNYKYDQRSYPEMLKRLGGDNTNINTATPDQKDQGGANRPDESTPQETETP